MKQTIINTSILSFVIAFICIGLLAWKFTPNENGYNNVATQFAQPQDKATFVKGEILYPDYAHDDTLVVVQAEQLTTCIQYSATDAEINKELHLHCIPIQELDEIIKDASPEEVFQYTHNKLKGLKSL